VQNSSSYAIQTRRVGLPGRSASSREEIIALKIKITIHYINDTAPSVILILPSLASSQRMGYWSASSIPAHLLSLLRSILPPLLVSIRFLGLFGIVGYLSLCYVSFILNARSNCFILPGTYGRNNYSIFIII